MIKKKKKKCELITPFDRRSLQTHSVVVQHVKKTLASRDFGNFLYKIRKKKKKERERNDTKKKFNKL